MIKINTLYSTVTWKLGEESPYDKQGETDIYDVVSITVSGEELVAVRHMFPEGSTRLIPDRDPVMLFGDFAKMILANIVPLTLEKEEGDKYGT